MSSQTRLGAARVNEIFSSCALRDDQDGSDSIEVEGIESDLIFRFDCALIEEHAAEIHDLLRQLPSQFLARGGSFLDCDKDNQGYSWADTYQTRQRLVVLGLAIGKVVFCLPRKWWHTLPQGLPYLRVITE